METSTYVGDCLHLYRFPRRLPVQVMGGCSSCEVAAVAVTERTSRVVFPDGELREYARTVTAARVLEMDAQGFVLCDADDMQIEGFVQALRPNADLQPGQLYFVLPRSMLTYRLHAEDMAALAVRASIALVGPARQCSIRAAAPLVSPDSDRRKREPEKGRQRRRKGGIRGRKFWPQLDVITE